MRRTVVSLAVMLAACGGGGDKAPTVAGVAAKLGCTGLTIETDNAQRELGAREEGQCTFAGEEVTVLTYNTNSGRDAMNKIAKEFGGIAVLGDRWTVRVDTDAMAEQVRTKLGGKVD